MTELSPFSDYENCTPTFRLLTTGTALDELGNESPLFASFPIACNLKIVTSPALLRLLQANQQIEPDAIALEGYCVSPMILPADVREETDALLTFNRVPGKFVLTLINPPYGRSGIGAVVEAEAGTKIVGWFIPGRQAIGDSTDLPPAPLPTGVPERVDFSFGDASPKTIYVTSAGQMIMTVQVVIQVPFNGLGADLSVGDLEVSDRLMNVDQVDPHFEAEYEANPSYTYISATPIILTIIPGEGCMQGSGYILLEV